MTIGTHAGGRARPTADRRSRSAGDRGSSPPAAPSCGTKMARRTSDVRPRLIGRGGRAGYVLRCPRDAHEVGQAGDPWKDGVGSAAGGRTRWRAGVESGCTRVGGPGPVVRPRPVGPVDAATRTHRTRSRPIAPSSRGAIQVLRAGGSRRRTERPGTVSEGVTSCSTGEGRALLLYVAVLTASPAITSRYPLDLFRQDVVVDVVSVRACRMTAMSQRRLAAATRRRVRQAPFRRT